MGRKAFLLVVVVVLTACGSPPAGPTPHPTADIATEEAAVYSAAIEVYLGGAPDPLVLADRTALDMGSDITSTLDSVAQQLTGVAPETLVGFKARNDQAYALRTDMALPFRYLLLSSQEEGAFFQPNGGGWDRFYEQYSNAQGIMRLSRVGFNGDMTQALVYAGNQSHYLAGAGVYYLLAKEDGSWHVVAEMMVWIS